MSFSASELGVRVYLEGIRIPVMGVTTTFMEGQPATADIKVIPVSGFEKITPRSMVHIFYLTEATRKDTSDFYKGQDEGKEVDEGNVTLGREYKLLFYGEYIGYSYAKTTQGRALILQCMDVTNYFSSIKQSAANYRTGGFEQIEQAFIGARRDRDGRTFYGKDLSDNLTKWVGGTKHYEIGEESPTRFNPNPGTSSTANEEDGSGFGEWKKDQSINVITGVHRAVLSAFVTGNRFYIKQMNRHRIPDFLVGLRGDTTADKLFNIKVFKKWLRQRVAGGYGQYKSIAEVLQQLMNILMYSSVTIPSPKMIYGYNQGELYKPYNDWVAWKNEGTGGGVGFYNYGPRREHHMGTSVNMFLIKPDFWYFPPPMCNVIFPDQYTNFSYSRNFINEPTRMIMRTQSMVKSSGRVNTRHTYSNRSPLGSGPAHSSSTYVPYKIRQMSERTYAPDFKAFSGLLKKGVGYRAQLYSVLLPHEKFVGPNTIFTWEGDMGGFGSKASRAQYLRIFADYLFWKIYYSMRQGSLEMPFSPQIVPGFSAVIMDPMDEVPTEDSPAKGGNYDYNPNGKYANHHNAYITAVIHDINQGGANTRVQLTAVRPFQEDVDFDAIATEERPAPFEDVVVRPMRDYFDARYFPENIGEQFYYPILGCKSILDEMVNARGAPVEGESVTKGGNISVKDCIKRLEFLYRYLFIDGDIRKAAERRSNNEQSELNGDRVQATDLGNNSRNKEQFITRATQRLGLPGEVDILGVKLYLEGLWSTQSINGNGVYVSSKAPGFNIDGETPLAGQANSMEAAVLAVMSQYADPASVAQSPSDLIQLVRKIRNGQLPPGYVPTVTDVKGDESNTGTTVKSSSTVSAPRTNRPPTVLNKPDNRRNRK